MNLKVLLDNNNYGVMLSALAWPSTGSTSTMVLALSNVVDRQSLMQIVMLSVHLIILAMGFILRPAFENLNMRLLYICFTAWLSWAGLLAMHELLSNGFGGNRWSIIESDWFTTVSIGFIFFHIFGYTTINSTTYYYGKSTSRNTEFI